MKLVFRNIVVGNNFCALLHFLGCGILVNASLRRAECSKIKIDFCKKERKIKKIKMKIYLKNDMNPLENYLCISKNNLSKDE